MKRLTFGESPLTQVFRVPPHWPAPPQGWTPPADWEPDPAWGPAPDGWVFWVEESSADFRTVSPAEQPRPAGTSIPLFGARKHARELAATLEGLQQENTSLRDQLVRFGAMDAVQIKEQISRLEADLVVRRQEVEQELHSLRTQLTAATSELQKARRSVVETREAALLQEVGVYEYQHPLDDSVAYKTELARLKDRTKAMNLKDGGAVVGATNWTVNGSAAQGRTMVRETSKLMLRAYNAEADNLVRSMKPYKLQSARDRLDKVAVTIEKLGKTMQVRISPSYHQLRLLELSLTADYLDKVAQEKEREREEKARLREERKAQEEIERERARLEKERQHYENALARLEKAGDFEAAERLRAQLAEINLAIEKVDYRAANIRAGYVYVISNIGAFGPDVVKIGMTRRLEPMDRVRELGDASVPFRFDVHALQFADDAVGLENRLHAHFAAQRVNQVNQRREFFYTTPSEVREQLLKLAGDLLTFEELPEALEYRQSSRVTGRVATASAAATGS